MDNSQQQGRRMPVGVYVSSLNPQLVREDLQFAIRQHKQGASQTEAARNLTGDHILRAKPEPSRLALVERYSAYVSDLVRREAEQPVDKLLASLQPSLNDSRHWEPAIQTLGLAQADSLVWRREHGDIQSYQQWAEPKGWLHIDSGGQFFDRSARPVSAEQALSTLGITSSEIVAQTHSKDTPSNAGLGVSM